jgi:1,4-alpha-glucan branching enzyme
MIEYWETASSIEEQENYQRSVPLVSVPNEMINQWEDWQPFDDPSGKYRPPVFTAEEAKEIEDFHRTWNQVAFNTPDPLPELGVLKTDPEWLRLMHAAKKAIAVFMKRGKMDEEDITEPENGSDA